MNEEMKAKRQQLKALSKAAAEMVKTGEAESINEAIKSFYAADGHTEINTFKQWLEKGFCVKKGEKALLLWGRPKKEQDKENKPPTSEANAEEPSDFWPLAYVFSNKQVSQLQKK